jgi:hypothetical protein
MLSEQAMERLRAIARGEQQGEDEEAEPASGEDASESAEDPNDESACTSET